MWIENAGGQSVATIRAKLRELEKGELMATEIAQKAAMHALATLLRIGVTAANAQAMLDSLGRIASVVAEESKRRGLPITDDPRGS